MFITDEEHIHGVERLENKPSELKWDCEGCQVTANALWGLKDMDVEEQQSFDVDDGGAFLWEVEDEDDYETSVSED